MKFTRSTTDRVKNVMSRALIAFVVLQNFAFAAPAARASGDFNENSATTFYTGENNVHSSVIDAADGYAYFGTEESLVLSGASCKIVKVRLSDNAKVAVLPLGSGETDCVSGVIDTTHPTHYAYFGLNTSPAKVVKIDLSTFTEVDAITFSSGENDARVALMDTATGFAYFGTVGGPSYVVKVDINPSNTFARIGATSLGINYTAAGVIDTSGATHYAYFNGDGSPTSYIVKVDLDTFSTVGSPLGLATDETEGFGADIDMTNGFAYFSSYYNNIVTPSPILVKIRLSDFTERPRVALSLQQATTVTVDTTNGYVYVGGGGNPLQVDRVILSSFTEDTQLTVDPTLGGDLETAVIDTTGGAVWFGDNRAPGRVFKIDLSSFTQASGSPLLLNPLESYPTSEVIDTVHGYAYYALSASLATIVKVRTSDNAEVASLILAENVSIRGGVIDAAATYLYYALTGSPGTIAKIRLSDFTEFATLPLGSGENDPNTAVIDAANGFAYFGTDTSPGQVVKIDLSTFTEAVGSPLSLGSGEDYLDAATIDTANGFAYFMPDTDPGQIAKIDLSTFAEAAGSPLTLASDEAYPSHAAIDMTNGFAYVDTYPGGIGSTNKLVKIRLSDFTENINFAFSGFDSGAAVVIDEPHGFAFVGVDNAPGDILKIQLSDMTQADSITLGSGEDNPDVAAIDINAGYAYFGTNTSPARSAKVQISSGYTPPSPTGPTTANKILLSRLRKDTDADVTIYYTLPSALSGVVTVTFPADFVVNGPPTAPGSSGCLSSFGYTSSTVFATKTSCSGGIFLGGFSVHTPTSAGSYHITWVNDAPGGGDVYIVEDDQVVVDATVDPSITFDAGTQASVTDCDGTFSSDGGTLALGTISPTVVTSSDSAGIDHLCTRLNTNAISGAVVQVASRYGALKSASTSDTIPSFTAAMATDVANYGLCAGSALADFGTDPTTPAGATPVQVGDFSGTCTPGVNNVGALTTSPQTVWTLSGPSSNAFQRLYVKAEVSATTPAHADYGDTLTFTATGVF